MSGELKHCITSSSEQFNGKIKKTQIEIFTKFYAIEFCRISTKEFTIPKVIVSHKPLVEHWTNKLVRH